MVKDLPANAGDTGSISESGRSPGGGHDNPLQYSCLENPMDRGAWGLQPLGSHRVGHDWVCTHVTTICWGAGPGRSGFLASSLQQGASAQLAHKLGWGGMTGTPSFLLQRLWGGRWGEGLWCFWLSWPEEGSPPATGEQAAWACRPGESTASAWEWGPPQQRVPGGPPHYRAVGAGQEVGALQTPRMFTVLSEVFLNDWFFICCPPFEQSLETLNDCLFCNFPQLNSALLDRGSAEAFFLHSGSPVLRWFFLYLCLSLIEQWALDHSIWEAVRWESMGNSDMQTVPENSALQTPGASSDFKWFIYFCFLPLKVIKQNVCGSFHCIPWICDTLHFQIGRRHQTNEGVTPRRTELALLVFQFLCEIGNGSQTTNDVFKMVF